MQIHVIEYCWYVLAPRQKWDCCFAKTGIFCFFNLSTCNKFPKADSNLTWYFYIALSWLPGLRVRFFKACRTSLWHVWRHISLFAHCVIPVLVWHLIWAYTYNIMTLVTFQPRPKNFNGACLGFVSSVLGHSKHVGLVNITSGQYVYLVGPSWKSSTYQCDAFFDIIHRSFGPTTPS